MCWAMRPMSRACRCARASRFIPPPTAWSYNAAATRWQSAWTDGTKDPAQLYQKALLNGVDGVEKAVGSFLDAGQQVRRMQPCQGRIEETPRRLRPAQAAVEQQLGYHGGGPQLARQALDGRRVVGLQVPGLGDRAQRKTSSVGRCAVLRRL